MSKHLVIYHANCTDGFTAAWCFHHYAKVMPNPPEYTFFPASYGSTPPDLAGFDRVYLVDFSYKREVVQKMIEQCPEVWLLDHHETAIRDLMGLRGLHTRTTLNKSGAMIAWEFLFSGTGEKPPRMLEYVQDRDLWKWKLPMSKEINTYTGSVARSFEAWDTLMLSGDDVIKLARFGAYGQAILQKHEKDCGEIARRAVKLDVMGHKGVLVVNCPPTHASDVGALLSEHAPFAVMYHYTESQLVFSLRSSEDNPEAANVAELAQSLGGGGHKHAAGCAVPRSNTLELILALNSGSSMAQGY